MPKIKFNYAYCYQVQQKYTIASNIATENDVLLYVLYMHASIIMIYTAIPCVIHANLAVYM